jgi:hypothetical protein
MLLIAASALNRRLNSFGLEETLLEIQRKSSNRRDWRRTKKIEAMRHSSLRLMHEKARPSSWYQLGRWLINFA